MSEWDDIVKKTEHPVVSALIVAAICGIVGLIFTKGCPDKQAVTSISEKVQPSDDKLKKLVALYNDKETIGELRNLNINKYFTAGLYDKSAIITLEQDKLKGSSDYSLWIDLALSIRMYALHNGTFKALEFTDELSNKYGNKLLTHVWAVLPIEIIHRIKDRSHSVSQINDVGSNPQIKGDLESIVEKYPNDKFQEMALYALGEYEEALRMHPNNFIQDILLYAAGNELFNEIQEAEMRSPTLPSRDISNKAISYFDNYINLFPDGPLADDASYKAGTLARDIGDQEKAIIYFRNATMLGNMDFGGQAIEAETDILDKLPQKTLIERLETDKQILLPSALWYGIVKREYKRNDFTMASFYAEKGLQHGGERDFGVAEVFKNKLKYILLSVKRINDAIKTNDLKIIMDEGGRFRKEYNYRAATYLYDIIIKLHPDSNFAPTANFLKIITLRDWKDFNMMEAEVRSFLKKYPNDQFADDALAELAFVQLLEQNRITEGERTVRTLEEKYRNANAVDNALNWLAYAYYSSGETEKTKAIYQEIVLKFPNTRFGGYARKTINTIIRESAKKNKA